MKQKKLLIGIAGLILVLIIFGAVFTSVNNTSTETQTIGVRLKWLFFSNYSGAIAANENKFFPSNWTVNINPGGFETDSIKLVASGSDQFGITSSIELLKARAKGVPVIAVCADFQKSPVAFLSLKSSNITNFKQIEGKKVGMKFGTDTCIIYYAILNKEGLDAKKVSEIPVKFSTLPLIEEEVDVFPSYFMTDPVNLEAKSIKLNIMTPDEYGITIYGNVLFTTEQLIKEKPEMVREFVRAYVKGWRWAVENPVENSMLFEKLNPKVPAKNQEEILKRTIPFLVVQGGMDRFGSMNIDKWNATMETIKEGSSEMKDVDLEKLSIDGCFTNEFLPSK